MEFGSSRFYWFAVSGLLAAWLEPSTVHGATRSLAREELQLDAVEGGVLVIAPGSRSIRLRLDDSASGVAGPFFVVSLKDGARQHLTRHQLTRQWFGKTAWFNGDTLYVRGVTTAMVLGAETPPRGPDLFCDDPDPRILSSDPREGRLITSAGVAECTSFLVRDSSTTKNKGLLSANHCAPQAGDVVEFHVPLSNEDGTVNHPGPEDQYALDPDSIQRSNHTGTNDWSYFGCFPNTETTLNPVQAQGAFFLLPSEIPDPDQQPLRVTGYGTYAPPADPTHNQALTTDVGTYLGHSSGQISYNTFTTGGDSGGPAFIDGSQEALGINVLLLCSGVRTAFATATTVPGLVTAVQNPRGVLIPGIENCYADCNGDGVLDDLDFDCFQALFDAGSPIANCNGDLNPDDTIRLDDADFDCFRELFAQGCP